MVERDDFLNWCDECLYDPDNDSDAPAKNEVDEWVKMVKSIIAHDVYIDLEN